MPKIIDEKTKLNCINDYLNNLHISEIMERNNVGKEFIYKLMKSRNITRSHIVKYRSDRSSISECKTTCSNCEKEILRPKYRIKVRAGIFFCCIECKRTWMKLYKSGKNHPRWIEDKERAYCEKFNNEFKQRVRYFFNNRCVVCNKSAKENGKQLSVHHVNYIKSACCEGDVITWRFVPLCNQCHGKTGSIYQRDYWTNYFNSLIDTKYNGKCYYTKEEWEVKDLTLFY